MLSERMTRSGWAIVETPPMTGDENMRWDAERLRRVATSAAEPTLRFFRFKEPTVTFGRLQKEETVRHKAPAGWPLARRPTAGGIVLHETDLCLSLVWRPGTFPMPSRVREVYGVIHGVVLKALSALAPLRLASCCDTPKSSTPFDERECFQEPVGYDVLDGQQKRVGGALAMTRHGCLYQGSIQTLHAPDLLQRLEVQFCDFFDGK